MTLFDEIDNLESYVGFLDVFGIHDEEAEKTRIKYKKIEGDGKGKVQEAPQGCPNSEEEV